VRSKTALELV